MATPARDRQLDFFVYVDTVVLTVSRDKSRAEADAFVDRRIASVGACLEDLARLRSHGRFCVKEQLVTVRELLAGIGEAHSAHSTALLLRDRDVNAQFVDLTLWDQDDLRSLDQRIGDAFAAIDLSRVLPIVTYIYQIVEQIHARGC
jgi:aspartate kinase